MRRLAALSLSLVFAAGLSACGGDDEATSDIVPESVPELRAPENTTLPAAPTNTDTTSTTDTTVTSTTPATATPAPATTTPQQTGGAAPQTQQGTQTGNSGGFSDFCAQNPGACPGN